MRRLTLRAKIMRGIVAPFFAVLAVLSVALGVANATFWKPNDVVIAYTKVTGTRYIVTDPGVLNLVDNRVRVSVAALHTRKPICVAVGLTKDVRGWIAGSSVQRITGLHDWNNLSVKKVSVKNKVAAEASTDSDDPDVPFKKSNLWPIVTCQLGLAKLAINTADYVQTAGSASYDHAVATGAMKKSKDSAKNASNHKDARSIRIRSQAAKRVLLIDLGDNSPEASIELRWRRHQVPDFATPLYFIAVLFAALSLLAATIFAMEPHRRRNKQLVASRSGVLTVKSARSEEVSFIEAFAGTWSGMFGHKHHKKSSGSHARHGSHARNHKNSSYEGNNQIDDNKQVRTAYASTAVSSTDSLAETTVISQDELLAFAARFSQQHDANSKFNSVDSADSADSSDSVDSADSVDSSKDSAKDSTKDIAKDSANSKPEDYAESKENSYSNKNKQDNKRKQNAQNRKNSQNNNRKNKSNGEAQNQSDSKNKNESRNKHGLQNKSNSRGKYGSQNKQGKDNNRNNQNNPNNQNNQNNQRTNDGSDKSKKQSKQQNKQQSRNNRRGYHGSNNNSRYRKNSKGYRGNEQHA